MAIGSIKGDKMVIAKIDTTRKNRQSLAEQITNRHAQRMELNHELDLAQRRRSEGILTKVRSCPVTDDDKRVKWSRHKPCLCGLAISSLFPRNVQLPQARAPR